MDFTGVEIAWVELKSNKPVGLISSTYWSCNPNNLLTQSKLSIRMHARMLFNESLFE